MTLNLLISFAISYVVLTGLMYIGRRYAERTNASALPRKSYWLSQIAVFTALLILNFIAIILFPAYSNMDINLIGILALPIMGYLIKRRNSHRGKPDVTTWMYFVPFYWIYVGISIGLAQATNGDP